MQLNSFYFSREPISQNEFEARLLRTTVNTGEYRKDTLYVFIDSNMWEIAKQKDSGSAFVEVLDSVPVLAPDL
jgi:hypothetical protein